MNGTLFKRTMILCLLFAFTGSYAQILPRWERIQPKYETADVFVAGFNVMDYGADPTGTTDQTHLFQQLLDSLGSRTINKGTRWNDVPNGGILYVPEGKYLFRGSLTLPKGVTIRGDWEKPVKGQPIKGTILMSANPNAKGNDVQVLTAYEIRSFIILQPSSAVRDINIWYPEQDADNIVAYPPAILLGDKDYWGNDYTLVSHVTLVNAYDGVIFSRLNGGGAPNCYGVYGTPLKRGIEIDNIAEVGRIDNVDFSPDYWAGSGLPGSPSINGPHKSYIAENATAVVMRRNDWSFIGTVKAEGYNIGYRLDLSYNPDTNGNRTAPNGHNYGMEFTDCKYGVYVAAVSGAGMMFYNYTLTDCDYGFFFAGAPGGVVQIQGCRITANSASLYAPQINNTKIIINQSVINKGPVDIRGGLASVVNCDFNNDPDQIILGPNARAIITGNRFKKEASVKNVSLYECIIDHDPIEMSPLPDFPYKNQYDFVQKPSGNAYYVATDNGVSVEADDNSDALQALLDRAENEGGGLIFIPPGHYNFRKPIRIPTGVELKGSVDTPTLPMGAGTVMEIYAGKGEEEDETPFISMEPGSGIRGFVMDYPEQVVQLLTEPELNGGDVYHYPYTIRGNKDVYIVNIAFRACYRGIDLYTNACDNHFVDYPAGHVFKTGIRVGGGSKGGHIYNAQFNQIAYGSGGETKFGAWPNSPDNTQPDQAKYNKEYDLAYAYCWNNLDFLILEDCEDQVMFNNFDFGSNRGFILASENGKGPQGISLGQGIDQGMNAFYIGDVGEKGFNFINSQIVTTAPGNPGEVQQTYKDNNRYIQVDPNFKKKVTFFGADFWGQPQNISVDVLNGTLELQAGNFSNSGQRTFASVQPDAAFDVIGTNINPINSLLTSGSEPSFYIQSSMVNSEYADTASCGLWFNNLDQTASSSPNGGAFLPRVAWIATASVYNDDAGLSLDGDLNTRWSTSTERQKPGQWFMVDMLTEQIFTGIYMETGGASYYPVNYKVLISSDGENWIEVASGGNSNQIGFDKQTARYVKAEQTGSGISAWRIAEFYVTNTDIPPYTGIEYASPEDILVWFSDGQIHTMG
ncbi:MAG: discoidin domain-containing protein, partial [Candidatus Azobacteroides sp.]|nr:discoidin domain-containing protein [Candidatus Azobacteroides sp.]